MNIHAKVIPDAEHRPNITGADWYFDQAGDLQVRVSKMSDWRYEAALMVHELIEAILCKHDGVSHIQVDDFDIPYESSHSKKCDAGDEKDCPYRMQHGYATAAERILSTAIGINWLEYDRELEKF